jgi:hypothetical protein
LDSAVVLNPLPSNDGAFQDAPRWGRQAKHHWVRDFACLAVPDSAKYLPLKPAKVSFSREHDGDLGALTDSSFAGWVTLPRIVEEHDEVFCSYEFETPVSIGSATIGVAGPTGFGSPRLPSASLEASADGAEFTTVAEFPMEVTMGQSGEVPSRTISFPQIVAKFFRLKLASIPMSEALPPLEQGVAGLPFKPVGFDKFHISEFALYPQGKIHGFEYKAGFGIAKNYQGLEIQEGPSEPIQQSEVIDLTEFLDPESGVLNWKPESGSWRIFRLGYSLTGAENGPAPEEATGLEIDKLDASRVESYLSEFFEPLFAGLEERRVSRSKIAGILSDSIESKAQNFTESLPSEFESRRGYSLRPWLLALAGWVVNSSTETDKFLYDFRLTISELVSDCMYRLIGDYAQQNGAVYYSEALESHRPQLGDDLQMRAQADIPMGAMWTWLEGDLPIQTYLADLKGASSVAHVYGKRATGCESFSTYAKPFSFSPKTLKKVADLELALGVTLFNIHSSPHQPSTVPGPGVTLAPTLGQVFTRNETWAEMARPWMNYLSRCCMLLNSGSPKADILYFTGEEAPVTAIWGDDSFEVPSGYDFDLVSASGLEQITVTQGQLRSSQGRYSMLYVGGSSTQLSVQVLQQLIELADSGAKIFGDTPVCPPGLLDSQAEFENLLQRLFAHPNVSTVSSIAEAISMAEAARLISRAWHFREGDQELDSALVPGAEIRCIARTASDFDLYFVANAKNKSLGLSMEVAAERAFGYLIDPVSPELSRRIMANDLQSYDFDLEPYGSRFLYLSDTELDLSIIGAGAPNEPEPSNSTTFDSWSVEVGSYNFESGATFDWSTVDDEAVRYHSGVASFTASFEVVDLKSRYQLEFPEIAELAEVFVNHQKVGTAWATGHKIDISDWVVAGTNRVQLKLINNWRNRLIGDQFNKERLPGANDSYIGQPIFEQHARLQPAGILKPVLLWTS